MHLCLNCETQFPSQGWSCPGCSHVPAEKDGLKMFAPDLSSCEDHFLSNSFDDLALLEENSFWFKARNSLIIWALKKYFPNFSSFLEIGCGTGYVISGIRKEFPKAQTLGSELSANGLSYAKGRLGVTSLIQMDARNIPFVNEFDVIGLFDVLEHIEEDVLVLEQINKAAKNGGGLIITVPQHQFLWSAGDEYANHVRRYSAKDLRQKLVATGFDVQYVGSFVSLLLPALCLSRLMEKGRAKAEYDPKREYAIPAWISSSFEVLMAVERVAIKSGIKFPAGGSLLVVATARKSIKVQVSVSHKEAARS